MSERFSTWIRIGGRIRQARVKSLLEAIRAAAVRLDWGEAYFEPRDAAELMESRRDGVLHLCDEEARYGEFPELEKTCRRLRLSYQRHSEGTCGYDAGLTDWRHGMPKPIYRRSSNEHTHETMLLASEIEPALKALMAGKTKQAIRIMQRIMPTIPELPPFEII